MNIAKIFWSGKSQALRLPKEFRFSTKEVRIRRSGSSVILEPVVENWDWLVQVVGPVDEDFIRAADEPLEAQNRPALDYFK